MGRSGTRTGGARLGTLMVGTLLALMTVVAGVVPAAAAGEAFTHRGWKGYVISDEPLGGCRMAHALNGPLFAVAHVTAEGQFLIGFVDPTMNVRVGTTFEGYARFDGQHLALGGSADNPQLVTFAHSNDARLERAFRLSRRMRMEWSNGRGWIDMGLSGSDRATDLLRECARRQAPPPPPPVVSYAPAAPAPSARLRPPSFDCRYAGLASEFAVCVDPVLGDLDARMADLHGLARARSNDRAAFDRANERWRAGRDGCGASVACIEDSYRRRIGELGIMAGIY